MTDEYGGIDKNIQGIVTALNERGILTSGSCEGHADHGAPSPWVSTGINFKERVQQLLDAFYKKHPTSEDVRIVIHEGKSVFWLHNGGELFNVWRTYVDEIVENKKSGKKIISHPPKEDVKNIESKLKEFQKEFEDFAEFVKTKQ